MSGRSNPHLAFRPHLGIRGHFTLLLGHDLNLMRKYMLCRGQGQIVIDSVRDFGSVTALLSLHLKG